MSKKKETNVQENVIHVVLAVYDPQGTYSRHAGVVITSMFEHTNNPVCVHILHDDTLTDDNRRRFSRTAEKFKQDIRFVDVTDSFLKINQDNGMDKLSKKFTRGTFFRLLIPDLLDIEKVIYMDCDIAVNMDIAELCIATRSISNFSLAAVIELSNIANTRKKFFERARFGLLKLECEKYFNAGVLVMNLESIRQKHNLPDEVRAFYKRYEPWAMSADQDFLNAAFKDDVFFIDERFNRFLGTSNSKEFNGIEGAIVHFAAEKPWTFPKNSKRDRFYWEIFMRSEWNDQFFDAIRALSNSQYLHRHTSDCIKRLVSRLLNNLCHTFTVSLPKRFNYCKVYLLELRREMSGRR
jgi:lipopolysaccharide biosynthesis glycosyltransferase